MRCPLLRRRKRAAHNIEDGAGNECGGLGGGDHAGDCKGGERVAGGVEQGIWEVERGEFQGVEETVAGYEAEGGVGESGELSGGKGDRWWWTKVDESLVG